MEYTKYWPTVLWVLLVGELALNLPDGGLPLSVYIVFSLMVLQIVILSIRPKPKIEIIGGNIWAVDLKGSSITRDKNKIISVSSSYVITSFENNPKIRTEEATAKNAYAEIFTYRKNGEKAFAPFRGIWATDYSPPFVGEKFSEKTDIDSSGFPTRLILARNKFTMENDSGDTKEMLEVSPVDKTDMNDALRFTTSKQIEDESIYFRIQIFASNYKSSYFWVVVTRSDKELSARDIDNPPFKIKD